MSQRQATAGTLIVALFLLVMATLLLEVALTRAFDVILDSNLAYVVISSAILGLGMAGVYQSLWPPKQTSLEPLLGRFALLFGLSSLAVLPTMNILPFDLNELSGQPLVQAGAFLGMYLALVLPFFCSGLFLVSLFAARTDAIQRLYFWDLVGAGIGCIIAIPLIRPIGPGGITFVVAGFGVTAFAVLHPMRRSLRIVTLFIAILVAVLPFVRDEYFDFAPHMNKRRVRLAHEQGHVLTTVWDPVSKIEVLLLRGIPWKLHIAYDGGTQSSHFFHFDGDYRRLRTSLETEDVERHFWGKYTFISHYLMELEQRQHKVLVIGAAGGQETKAALAFGAAHVDAVELVRAVVDLGMNEYADFCGHVYNDPRVEVHVDEGRAFLRRTDRRYDVIQLHSIHTSSSAAQGTGALSPTYLQTAEAYLEYFAALEDDGILHINHHYYPRMLTTAAAAWKKSGREDFRSHVVVIQRAEGSVALPTTLIRMRPWTKTELESIRDFFANQFPGDPTPYVVLIDPIHPEGNELPAAFFSAPIDPEVTSGMEYDVSPCTDDRPFFQFIRKRHGFIDRESSKFATADVAEILNASMRKFVPMDLAHLYATGAVAATFLGVFLLVPMRLSGIGRRQWPGKGAVLVYFSCLGAGFIIIELVLIQVSMQLIGVPVHTVSTVLFVMLTSAGIGSLASQELGLHKGQRAFWAFAGIGAMGLFFTIAYPAVYSAATHLALPLRILVSVVMIFPLGFVLGMPFPLGMRKLADQRSAVPWVWAMNGLFTVIGSLASVVLAITVGFRVTMFVALGVYCVAAAALGRFAGQANCAGDNARGRIAADPPSIPSSSAPVRGGLRS